jgi:predicted transcriptional regulator
MLRVEQSKLLQSIFNEFRISIINQLLLKEENIAGLSKKLKIERSKLCYHLNILANEKILNSKYVILEKARSKGKAGKVYSINQNKFKEVKKVLEDFKNEVDKLGS